VLKDLVTDNGIERMSAEGERVGDSLDEVEPPQRREFVHVWPFAKLEVAAERVVAKRAKPLRGVAIATAEVENLGT
jgi:hypothetical protein